MIKKHENISFNFPGEQRIRQFIIARLPLIVISLCFCYLLFISWGKWGSLIIDTFRDPLAAEKILQGKVLYKDFFYSYGIFAPYFLAMLCQLFGLHVYTFVGCGVGVTIAMALLLYKISRLFLDRIISTLVVVTFLYVCAFGRYMYTGIFNFIFPYSFASVFFSLFILAALYYFLLFIHTEKRSYLFLWNLFMSCAFLSRIELSLLIWAGFFCTAVAYIIKKRNAKSLSVIALMFLPLVCVSVIYGLFIGMADAFSGFRESIIDHIFHTRTNGFVLSMGGFNNIQLYSYIILKSFFMNVGAVILIGAGCHLVSGYFDKKKDLYVSLIIGIIFITAAFLIPQYKSYYFWQFRCLSLILVSCSVIFFLRIFNSSDFKENLSLFALFSTALLFSIRIFFRITPISYGFSLMPLGLICYYVFFFTLIKRSFDKVFYPHSHYLYHAVLVVFFLAFINSFWQYSAQWYSGYNSTIGNERGVMKSFNDERTRRVWKTVEYLKNQTPHDATVIVVPEGASINYFSKRRNPLRNYGIVPPIVDIIGEKNIIDQFIKVKADYIVLTSRFTHEFGAAFFGIDYARGIMAWINENYTMVEQIGPFPFTTLEFGIAIYERN
ncbi:MAG: hypothetical protein KKH94_00315 [Candidatus Omnitrophica bacterium]|nr:hypothetical protein [Candidatus Omnitrophota bacterium]